MDINATLRKIAENDLEQTELYQIAREAIDSVDMSVELFDFFSEVRDSTRHAAVLGCGPELDYDLLRKDARALMTHNVELRGGPAVSSPERPA